MVQNTKKVGVDRRGAGFFPGSDFAIVASSKPEDKVESNTFEPMILDFLEWLAQKPRPYHDVMDAWRTSCPRFPVWEDSVDAGYVTRVNVPGHEQMIQVTPVGLDLLEQNGRRPASQP